MRVEKKQHETYDFINDETKMKRNMKNAKNNRDESADRKSKHESRPLRGFLARNEREQLQQNKFITPNTKRWNSATYKSTPHCYIISPSEVCFCRLRTGVFCPGVGSGQRKKKTRSRIDSQTSITTTRRKRKEADTIATIKKNTQRKKQQKKRKNQNKVTFLGKKKFAHPYLFP